MFGYIAKQYRFNYSITCFFKNLHYSAGGTGFCHVKYRSSFTGVIWSLMLSSIDLAIAATSNAASNQPITTFSKASVSAYGTKGSPLTYVKLWVPITVSE